MLLRIFFVILILNLLRISLQRRRNNFLVDAGIGVLRIRQ